PGQPDLGAGTGVRDQGRYRRPQGRPDRTRRQSLSPGASRLLNLTTLQASPYATVSSPLCRMLPVQRGTRGPDRVLPDDGARLALDAGGGRPVYFRARDSV